MMEECMAQEAEDRPTFERLKNSLTTVLNMNDEHYGYIELERDVRGTVESNNLKALIEEFSHVQHAEVSLYF